MVLALSSGPPTDCCVGGAKGIIGEESLKDSLDGGVVSVEQRQALCKTIG